MQDQLRLRYFIFNFIYCQVKHENYEKEKEQSCVALRNRRRRGSSTTHSFRRRKYICFGVAKSAIILHGGTVVLVLNHRRRLQLEDFFHLLPDAESNFLVSVVGVPDRYQVL